MENQTIPSKNLWRSWDSDPAPPRYDDLFFSERGLKKFCGGRFKKWAGRGDFWWVGIFTEPQNHYGFTHPLP
jgi:hypothetical protein